MIVTFFAFDAKPISASDVFGVTSYDELEYSKDEMFLALPSEYIALFTEENLKKIPYIEKEIIFPDIDIELAIAAKETDDKRLIVGEKEKIRIWRWINDNGDSYLSILRNDANRYILKRDDLNMYTVYRRQKCNIIHCGNIEQITINTDNRCPNINKKLPIGCLESRGGTEIINISSKNNWWVERMGKDLISYVGDELKELLSRRAGKQGTFLAVKIEV